MGFDSHWINRQCAWILMLSTIAHIYTHACILHGQYLVSLCGTTHAYTYSQGGMFSRGGSGNWIRPQLNAAPFARTRLCFKKVGLVADGKQMWTEPCMVKVQSQSPTSTSVQKYIFIKENKGVHLHLLEHIKSHSSVWLCVCVCVESWDVTDTYSYH